MPELDTSEMGTPETGISGFGAFTSKLIGLSLLAAGALLSGANIAHADAIDGDWCSETGGRRIAIEGPSVTTPKGVRMQGNYSRHAFAFTMPPVEIDAGAPVEMRLQGESRVRVSIGGGEPQIWRRCPAGIS